MIPTQYIDPGVERIYPNFNDAPHARPILSEDGLRQALLILGALAIGLPGLALLLSLFT